MGKGQQPTSEVQTFPAPVYPEVLKKVFDAFVSRDIEAYLIGPRARDLARGEDISGHHSFDLTVDTSLAQIESLFSDLFGVVPKPVKEDRPRLVTFKIPKTPTDDDADNDNQDSSGHWTFNMGPFRNYLPPLRSLRGQNLSGIILDLATREITIQAFGYDHEGGLIDPFGGTRDLADNLVRPVFPTETVFRESAGWLLKVARYVARYGYRAAPEVRSSASRDASNLLDVPREFWRREMDKILCGSHAGLGLQFMADTRVLSFLLPEVANLVTFSAEAEGRHKDIWDHTKQVVDNAETNTIVRWAALCHDIGKVWTRQYFGKDKVHFFRHEDMSALLFEGIAARLQIPSETAHKIHYLIKNHSRINLYREDWTDSAVRRLIRDVGEHLDRLIAFSRADLTSKRAERVELVRSLLADLQLRIIRIKEADARVSPLPKDIGNRIMERFNLSPGPEIGRLRSLLLGAINDGRLAGGEKDDVYLDFIEGLASASPDDVDQNKKTTTS
ncbi:MAG: HD domain-containing protein [Deltaproteobacteria bacterium]|nr:HD domain-containing protein [Deltaproteobacteria bacterium]